MRKLSTFNVIYFEQNYLWWRKHIRKRLIKVSYGWNFVRKKQQIWLKLFKEYPLILVWRWEYRNIFNFLIQHLLRITEVLYGTKRKPTTVNSGNHAQESKIWGERNELVKGKMKIQGKQFIRKLSCMVFYHTRIFLKQTNVLSK